jgi:hypothetical protein
MKQRRLILVTGAPRSATTPVGNLLAQCSGAVSLYEPLGPTGLSWIRDPFPIVGQGLGIEPDELEKLIRQLAGLRLGRFKPQAREGSPPTLQSRIFGSRTRHSARIARLQPWSRTIIWKDPHAVMMVPDLVDNGLDVVVTARTPWAHAASYKRLGWRSKATQVYPRWSKKYGSCSVCENFLDRCNDNVVSAALLWRMSYLPLLRTRALSRVHLVTSEALERDERATYLDLLAELGLMPTSRLERTLSAQRRDGGAGDMSQNAHDWKRSMASLNRYWQDVLSPDDLANVHAVTEDLVPSLLVQAERPAVPDSEQQGRSADGQAECARSPG